MSGEISRSPLQTEQGGNYYRVRPFSSHRREEENYVAGAVRTAVSGAKPAGLFELGPQGLARRMESHGEVIRRDLKRLRQGRRGLAFEIEAPKLFGQTGLQCVSQETYRRACSLKFMAHVPTAPEFQPRGRLPFFPSLKFSIRAFLIHSAVPTVPFCDSVGKSLDLNLGDMLD